jgi:hypothetical protein
LEKWKQNRGSDATYINLIKVFEQAGYKKYAEIVKDQLMENMQADTGDSNTIIQTPPPPLEQPLPQLPIFPSQSEQLLSELPSYAAAAEVKLHVLQEDSQLGTKI